MFEADIDRDFFTKAVLRYGLRQMLSKIFAPRSTHNKKKRLTTAVPSTLVNFLTIEIETLLV